MRTLANCWSWGRLRELSWERSIGAIAGTVVVVVVVKKERRDAVAQGGSLLFKDHWSVPLFGDMALDHSDR